MAKKDLKDLGEVYGNLGKEETTVVAESTDKATVGDESAAVGEAPLEDGGITKDTGCEEPEEVEVADAPKEEDEEQLDEAHCDEEKEEDGECSDEEKEEDSECSDEEKEEEGEHSEEDEENALETAQAGINNFMAKKSAFDELYSKVISEDFGMEEQDDLNALGIEDATPDAELGEEGDDDADVAGEEEVTVTLDKELAKTLCDLLKAAMGEEEDAPEADEAGEHEDGEHEDGEHAEEDNEGELKAMTTHVDMGEDCCVGKPEGLGGEGKGHADGGKSAEQSKLGDSVKNDQKVGASEEIGDTKVEPKNKEVKAG